MSFTYVLANTIGQVRLELGDTVSGIALFTDEEITVKLTANADAILLTAADLCDILASRFSRDVDFEEDGQSVKRSQRAKAYAAQAKALREKAARTAGLSVLAVERRNREDDDRTGHVIAGWVDPDEP